MKSIKPGRGPSGMSFIGSIAAIIFGVFWTIIAASITSSVPSGMITNSPIGIIGKIFPLFGVIFIIIGIVQAVYHYKNTTGKDRFSLFDITDKNEEGDPANKWIKSESSKAGHMDNTDDEYNNNNKKHEDTNKDIAYCPFCGKPLNSDFSFCPKCGKDVRNS